MKTSTYPSVSPESCRSVKGSEAAVWNSFRSDLAEIAVGKDGKARYSLRIDPDPTRPRTR